jgi:hypothetical protein
MATKMIARHPRRHCVARIPGRISDLEWTQFIMNDRAELNNTPVRILEASGVCHKSDSQDGSTTRIATLKIGSFYSVSHGLGQNFWVPGPYEEGRKETALTIPEAGKTC